jgi:hypothetical protein
MVQGKFCMLALFYDLITVTMNYYQDQSVLITEVCTCLTEDLLRIIISQTKFINTCCTQLIQSLVYIFCHFIVMLVSLVPKSKYLE